ncbi:MAG: hypothetical protein R2787_00915 [Saprospiraceae bacterium]|nr:hypothetical protein [Saprospiraceae bacterium]MCB9311268.1 hypothetical protein [Lewinellaceae bacterium]HRW75609.1 hypothetical protein [Saprospiraceae bacterium]
MSRAISIIAAILTLGFLAGAWLPWWTIAIIAAIASFLVPARSLSAFLCGFLAGALLWGGLAWRTDWANDHLLSSQIGNLFNGISSMALILITAFIGGLVAGFGALSGSSLRAVFQKRIQR